MTLMFCLTICLLQILLYTTANQGKYTIIAPGSIFSNETYTVTVAVHHTSQPCLIKVGIAGPSYNRAKQVEVTENEVRDIDFDVPSLKSNDIYSLNVEGVDCLENFKNTTEIYCGKSIQEIIQFDKGLYNPGDDINFRVLFMDKDLKPVNPIEGAEIWITDSEYNTVKKIKDLKANHGVYSGKFGIPKHPFTGEWSLSLVNRDGSDSTNYFTVDDKYIVNVEVSKSVSIKDGDMQVVVTANHVSGKPVEGKVKLDITLDILERPNPPPVIKKAADMVKGKAVIDFNYKDAYSNYTYGYRNSISITAKVKERFTDVIVTETASTYNYPFRYTMSCIRMNSESCLSFEGGKENEFLFQVLYINRTYVNDTKSAIEFTYTEVLRRNPNIDGPLYIKNGPKSQKHTVTFKGHMNETGFVNVKVRLNELPEYEKYIHYYLLKYKYLDETRVILYTYQNREVKNKPRKYFRLEDESLTQNKLHLNKLHQVTVNSSEPFSYFVYNIIGHRNIITSDRIDLPDKSKEYNLALTPELSWGRKFRLYVYYVDENGEFHYAEKKYGINVSINHITLTAPKHVKPGEEMAIGIQTTPNSFVGLMAVDQKALLMRKNSDIQPSRLERVFDNFGTFTPRRGFSSYYPGTTSGCVTMTNADYFYGWLKTPDHKPNIGEFGDGLVNRETIVKAAVPLKSSAEIEDVAEFSAVCASGGTDCDGKNPVNKGNSQTWIFANIENTEYAEFKWPVNVPSTTTTWVLTAFSFNPSTGLSATDHATEITAL